MQSSGSHQKSSALPSSVDPSAHSVLVVDDENAVRELMTRWLQSGGYHVATAASAEDAIGLMDQAPTAVALCDIRLPGRNGLWLADRIRHGYPETAVIMATGVHDVAPAVESLRQGVVDYLTKPFGRDRLREAVWRGMEWHAAARMSRRRRETLEQEVQSRQARLAAAIATLRVDSDESLDAMLALLTINDREACSHAYRVAALAAQVAKRLGLTDADVRTVERGALLHDIGKLAMPESLLRKPTPLSAEEQRMIRLHPAVGSALIDQLPYLASASAVVRDAHERVDGLGFPRGTRADSTWIGARIVSVADAYDTMTQPRAFREAIESAEALAELERCSDSQFDRRVVQTLKQVIVGD
jgi:putative nucleotidyltransferase with HDIG domain